MINTSRKMFIYISMELLFSFLVSFLFFFFLFFVNQILVLAQDILSKKIPFWDVAALIFFSLPAIIALSAPFGSLVGALMTVGRFSSDNEILAMQALGLSLPKIFKPIFFMSILITIGSFFVNDYLLPLGTLNFNKLYKKIMYSMPQLELESYSYKRVQDSIIITGEVAEDHISDLIIIDKDEAKQNRVILSKEAYFQEVQEDTGVLSFVLDEVFGQTSNAKVKEEYEYFESDKMIYNILLKDITGSLRSVSPREMSSYDVYQDIKEKNKSFEMRVRQHKQLMDSHFFELSCIYQKEVESLNSLDRIWKIDFPELKRSLSLYEKEHNLKIKDRQLHHTKLEFYQKFSLPFSCMVFAFMAFPIGLFSKRSGRTVGFGIGVLLSVVYWGLLISGRTLGFRVLFNPFWAMWFPNLFMFIIGLIFFAVRLRR